MHRRVAFAVFSLVVVATASCTAMRPFAEIRASLPAERFVSVGEQLVHVVQEGQGEPVMLVHGFGASSYSYRHVQPRLARSFHTAAIDLTGFGYTERPRDRSAYSREAQVDLVLGVMNALGFERAHLVGHSYGGALALWLAVEHPDRVRSLVLIDSAAPSYPDDRRTAVAAFRPLAKLFVDGALRPANVRRALERSFHDDTLVTPELVAAYVERLRVEGVADAYRGLTAPARRAPRFDWSRVDLPTLVVWGENDGLVSVAAGRAAASRLPRAEFAVLAATGHMPAEESPQALLAVLLPFLERVSSAG
jgi:pimeloyl-ACP methyl ester carboxylesterase